MVFWILTIAISIAMLVLTAASRGQGVEFAWAHMAISAAMAVTFSLLAVREANASRARGETEAAVSAVLARHMGLVWMWGALALAVTYGSGIATWKEWLGFFVAFAVAGSISILMAQQLSGSAPSPKIQTYSRYLGWAQLVGMVIVMLGLLIDGKMARFLTIQGEGWQDWAANNYFFFGALALAVISAYGLRTAKPQTP